MRRIFTLLILLACGLSVSAQFRRNRDRTVETPPAEQNTTQPALNYTSPNEYFIGGIDISGLNVLDKNAMISLTGLKVGDKIKIPGDQIATAIRKLWKHGLVGDVTISVERLEGQNAFLMVNLAERPRLTDFYFRGIPKGKESSLKDDMKLIKGKIVNDAMVRNTELTVKKFFAKKGFLNAQVKVVQERDTLNRGGVRLRVDVDLKQKVRINEVFFEGNSKVADASLKKQLKKTKEHARISIHRALLGAVLHTPVSTYKEQLDSSRKITF